MAQGAVALLQKNLDEALQLAEECDKVGNYEEGERLTDADTYEQSLKTNQDLAFDLKINEEPQ